MKTVIFGLVVLFCLCSNNSVDSNGSFVLQQYGGTIDDVFYDTTGYWEIPIAIGDVGEVGCRVRQDSSFLWLEPMTWYYSASFVRIVDYTQDFLGWEYKITVIK